MKAKLLKLLRLVGYVVPVMVKWLKMLALGLIKKLTGFANWARGCLNRANGLYGCSDTFIDHVSGDN